MNNSIKQTTKTVDEMMETSVQIFFFFRVFLQNAFLTGMVSQQTVVIVIAKV